MPWGKSSAKCTPLINGLEICDRVKPWHQNLNLSTMSLSDVLSVNSDGAYFKNSFCVTVNNTDGLEVLGHASGNKPFGGLDAIKGKPLPSTVVCVNKNKANMYLEALGEPRKFGEFVDELGECGVSAIRQVVEDIWSMKSENPTLNREDIKKQLIAPGDCNEDFVDTIIDNVVDQ